MEKARLVQIVFLMFFQYYVIIILFIFIFLKKNQFVFLNQPAVFLKRWLLGRLEDNFMDLPLEIKKTLVFFDLFDYPLTAYEVWRFLGKSCSYAETAAALKLTAGLDSRLGFYFLSGRPEIVDIRLRRYRQAHRKFRIAFRAAVFFRFIPWVKMVAVGNQIGAGNARQTSDIDFFIVTDPGRIWLTRLIAAGTMKILNLRPLPGRKKDAICLSFYVSTNALDLSPARLDQDDIYFRYWLATLVPVFDQNDAYADLIRANGWLARELPNWRPIQSLWPQRLDAYVRRQAWFCRRQWRWPEAWARSWQMAILPPVLKNIMNQNSNCLINDNMLKLYALDRREEFRRKYQKKLEKIKVVS